MKLRLLTLTLVCAATAVRAEDCPLVLNQRFQMHYNQWQSNMMPTASTTQAVYEVDASVPVFTYRLGAIAFNGAVEYNRMTYSTEADSQTGISHYGMRVSLFPYRPFRLYVDYQHSQTPDLFDSGRVRGNTWGAGFSFNSQILQDVRLTYRHGDSALGEARDDWSLWKMEANQHVGNTQLTFQSTRQEFKAESTNLDWRMFQATLDTESHIGREWLVRTRSQVQDNERSRWFDLGVTAYGPITGNWHSLTTLSSGATSTGVYRTANTFSSESLVFAGGRWNAHTSGAFSQVTTEALGVGSRASSGTLGGTYTVTEDWRLHADLGLTGVRQTINFQDAHRTTTTMNLGVARGGDVPELIRHSLFFLSDWTFDRRVREEYPPDFVPSELAQDMLRRRMRQSGSFGFTADVWRISDNTSPGKVDWARMTGQVQTRGGLTLYLAGDYKNDTGMAQPGLETRNSDFMLNGSYNLGVTSILASMSYSNSHQRLTPAGLAYGYSWMLGSLDGLSRHYSLGVTSRLGKFPLGAMVMRYESSMAPTSTSVSTWADLNFRQVSLRVRYETSRMDNGFRSSRIVLDLLRWFDTVCSRSW